MGWRAFPPALSVGQDPQRKLESSMKYEVFADGIQGIAMVPMADTVCVFEPLCAILTTRPSFFVYVDFLFLF